MEFRTLDGVDVKGKRALVRVDFNVPMQDGKVTDDTRLRSALPTIERLREGGGKTILLSHFDRPKGKRVPSMSLEPVVGPLADLLGAPVAFAEDCVGETAKAAVDKMKPGDVLLMQNVRFHAGEEANDPAFAKQLAANGDLYVNDAFSTAHRAHASTEGLWHHLLPAYCRPVHAPRAGRPRRGAAGSPKRPVLGIVGGSKVGTKLDLLHNLILKLDKLAIGGGMANTFLYAEGWEVGASYCEKELADTARGILAFAEKRHCEILLPIDIVVAEKTEPGAAARIRPLGALDEHERILDAGPETVERLCQAMDKAKTLIWNGPLGVFEMPPFDKGTVEAARHAAALAKAGKLVAVAGGGDTVKPALHAAGVVDDFTFVSTGRWRVS